MAKKMEGDSRLEDIPEKIERLQELLEKGLPVRKALRTLGLGWKSYYKYAPLIYSDPKLLIPVPKSFTRNHTFIGFKHEFLNKLRPALNEAAKYAAMEILVEQTIARSIGKGNSERSG